jgi:hypothetical protein
MPRPVTTYWEDADAPGGEDGPTLYPGLNSREAVLLDYVDEIRVGEMEFTIPGTLTTGAGTIRRPIATSRTLLGAIAMVPAVAASNIDLDINVNGSSIFASNVLRIPTGQRHSGFVAADAAAAANRVAGDYLTVDRDAVPGGSSGSAPTFVGTEAQNFSSGPATNYTPQSVTGQAAGDMQVVSITVFLSDRTIIAPAGWIQFPQSPMLWAPNMRTYYFYRFWDGTTATGTFSADQQAAWISAGMFVFRGVDTVDPIDQAIESGNSARTTHIAPGITTSLANVLLVVSAVGFSNAGAITEPAGLAMRRTDGGIHLGTRLLTAPTGDTSIPTADTWTTQNNAETVIATFGLSPVSSAASDLVVVLRYRETG